MYTRNFAGNVTAKDKAEEISLKAVYLVHSTERVKCIFDGYLQYLPFCAAVLTLSLFGMELFCHAEKH
jgi:hypothetical protein